MEKELFEIITNEQESYSDNSLYNITSYGNDINIRQIIEMYHDGDIEKPELQRKYVWTKNEASRFVDSILLGLPVPSIFLARAHNNKLLIVDGYQRITTIDDYMSGIFSGDGTEFKLSNSDSIYKDWRGKTYAELSDQQRRLFRTATIHAIIFEQKKPEDDTAMYQVFERLNTGGRVLKPQEIRNCVYHGQYNSMLLELNKQPIWRTILDSPKEDQRMADIEVILRFFAFLDFPKRPEINQKQINLLKYLNDYMGSKKTVSVEEIEGYKNTFIEILSFLYSSIGQSVFRTYSVKKGLIVWAKRINPVIFDALCTATFYCKNLIDLNSPSKRDYYDNYINLLSDQEFESVTKQRTTDVRNIIMRTRIVARIVFGVELDEYPVPAED